MGHFKVSIFMKKSSIYVYTINSRVVWVSDQLFWIPVLPEMHKTYEILQSPIDLEKPIDCINYVVKNFYDFNQDSLAVNVLPAEENDFYVLCHKKVEVYLNLSKIINEVLLLMNAPVAFNEAEQLNININACVNLVALNESSLNRHKEFITTIRSQKRDALLERYINFINEISTSDSQEKLQSIAYRITFNRLNII